ncbi:MAG: DUF3775 domain-containing protein [Rhodospirillales bacterium]|nr:DUF3775 domain-containing protein [Rhodospirillales bacterium]
MLTISIEKVCYLIGKARAFDAQIAPEASELEDNPLDDPLEVLFAESDDPAIEELKRFFESLSEDETIELLALTWLGQGDYDVEEWGDALADAKEYADERRVEAFLGIPLLGDYLEEGLAEFGLSCAEFEAGRA